MHLLIMGNIYRRIRSVSACHKVGQFFTLYFYKNNFIRTSRLEIPSKIKNKLGEIPSAGNFRTISGTKSKNKIPKNIEAQIGKIKLRTTSLSQKSDILYLNFLILDKSCKYISLLISCTLIFPFE